MGSGGLAKEANRTRAIVAGKKRNPAHGSPILGCAKCAGSG
jgi:hypothetical protein